MENGKPKYANDRPAKDGDCFIGMNANSHVIVGLLDENDITVGNVEGVPINKLFNAEEAFNLMQGNLQAVKQLKNRVPRETASAGWCKAGLAS